MRAVGIVALAILLASAVLANLTMRSGEAQPVVPQYGNIFQAGVLVGWASGAKISVTDNSLIEFAQISHARQLAPQDEFEYGGVKMRISQVVQVDYGQGKNLAAGNAARADKTLLRVTAKIRRSD